MNICMDEYLRVRNAEEIVKERKAWHYDQLDCGKCCLADCGGGGASSGGRNLMPRKGKGSSCVGCGGGCAGCSGGCAGCAFHK